MLARLPTGDALPSSGFGFEIPLGDPLALSEAAATWQQLGAALDSHGQTLSAAGQITLAGGGWSGPAAGDYAGFLERLIAVLTNNVESCAQANGALTRLASDLQSAQQATSAAMADCLAAQAEQTSQQQAADEAAQASEQAHQKALAAVHPAALAHYTAEANAAAQAQQTAQAAADAAGSALSHAARQGQEAWRGYQSSAAAAARSLADAGSRLRHPDHDPGLLDAVLTWVGHVNDLSGAGATGLVKGYDAAIAVAGRKLAAESTQVLGDSEALAAIRDGLPIAGVDGVGPDPAFNLAENARTLADSPITKVLTAGPSEEAVGVLGKVPYLGYLLTGVDMYMNRDRGVGSAVIEPLGNLALGTAVTEVSGSVVAGGIAAAADGTGTLATVLGAATFVPGVGEAVIVGGIAVGVVAGADWIYEHPGEALHGIEDAGKALGDFGEAVGRTVAHDAEAVAGTVAHGAEGAWHTATHVVHDLEPWNW